jgi:hypothetical protein
VASVLLHACRDPSCRYAVQISAIARDLKRLDKLLHLLCWLEAGQAAIPLESQVSRWFNKPMQPECAQHQHRRSWPRLFSGTPPLGVASQGDPAALNLPSSQEQSPPRESPEGAAQRLLTGPHPSDSVATEEYQRQTASVPNAAEAVPVTRLRSTNVRRSIASASRGRWLDDAPHSLGGHAKARSETSPVSDGA